MSSNSPTSNHSYSGAIWCVALTIVTSLLPAASHAQQRWTPAQAHQWSESNPWLVGCNFGPSSAINQLEMWQAETWDPQAIDRELGWAASIGLNTVRVFLHDVAWKNDRDGFHHRVDEFLDLSKKHGIKPMIVIFDGVWDPDPQAGPQRRPRTGVHNSGWVQSPGRYILSSPERQDALEEYVRDLVKQYGQDDRVLIWDLFNEPDNSNANSYGPLELKNKDEMAARLVRRSFEWARAERPKQPLTVGVWVGPPWNKPENLNQTHRAALELSDVISFHNYDGPEQMQARIDELKPLGRPLICTEFMARGNGSTFQAILPVLKRERVGAYCWGLVDGKTQTKYPWPTWQMPLMAEPDPWHHEIFHTDGSPYSQEEVDLIKKLTETP
ncbi:MAG: cellulase family glycosylhydrolase [Planctomycetales bacterium]|nr:cellulase family glycosylhydrolase [Planctomycetales bacterium]